MAGRNQCTMNKPTHKHYAHGIFYPLTGVEAVPLHPAKVFFEEGASTLYELWQMQKYGNYIKAEGTEFIERFIDNKTKSDQ